MNNILNQFAKDEIIQKYESHMKLLNQKRKRNPYENNEIKNVLVYIKEEEKNWVMTLVDLIVNIHLIIL